jgi:hypothetical protein
MSSLLTGLFQLRVEGPADVIRELFVVVAQPLAVVAVIEDDVVRALTGLVVGRRRPRLAEELADRAADVGRQVRRVELGTERLAARAPAALDQDALR